MNLLKEQSIVIPGKDPQQKKDVNGKFDIFAKTIKTLISSFIPRETILCDDTGPPWISNKIKKLINEKNTAF